MIRLASLLLIITCSSFAAWAEPAPITTGAIVDQMVDFDRLCNMPANPYKTIQFTSHDRRSQVPDGPDWFSNSDGFGGAPLSPFLKIVREPGTDGVGEYLMADVQGPGVLVRTWTATIKGNIQVFLDNAKQPIYDGPAIDFLQRPYDSYLATSGISAEELQGTFYQRDAGYCPMPFATRCRIVWKGDRRNVHFYYLQFRKYSEQVAVESFQPSDLKTYRKEIQRTARILADPDAITSPGTKQSFSLTVAPGERSGAVELTGPGALSELSLLVSAKDELAALRQTVMHIRCDGWSNPQVQSPVGDFFAAAPGVNPYQTLPFTVREDGQMTSRYVMPYKKALQIEFQNLGDQPVEINGRLNVKSRDWDDERSMHFYARWRVTHDLATQPAVDVPFLVANGAGRYVGTASLMMNPSSGTHSSGTWWGEGDEKVFVDDEKFPSWFGTGSEDYYNYSWSAVDLFSYPYCSQPRNDGPGNRGFVTNNRFHFIDDQPFNSHLSFYMELLAHYDVKGFSYACQAYHYGRPGIKDDHRQITPEDVRRPTMPGPFKPLAYHGSQGAIYIEPETVVEGKHSIEQDDFWSQGKLMVWKPTRPGDKLKLNVPIEEETKYQIRLGMAIDHRGGKVSATLDGKPFGFAFAGNLTNLYDARRTMIRASHSDSVLLTTGNHVLELSYEGGQNAEDPFVGVDFIWLQP